MLCPRRLKARLRERGDTTPDKISVGTCIPRGMHEQVLDIANRMSVSRSAQQVRAKGRSRVYAELVGDAARRPGESADAFIVRRSAGNGNAGQPCWSYRNENARQGVKGCTSFGEAFSCLTCPTNSTLLIPTRHWRST